MKDDRFREPGLRPLRHPYPRDAILVAATPQRALPEVDDMVPEHGQCTGVGRHCVIAEVATNDVPQPFPLIREWLVHALPQLLFDHPQLRPHAVPPGLPLDQEVTRRDLPLMKVNPKKLKVSGLPSPRRLRLSAAKRPNSISLVLSGCSDSENSFSRARMISRKRRASASNRAHEVAAKASSLDHLVSDAEGRHGDPSNPNGYTRVTMKRSPIGNLVQGIEGLSHYLGRTWRALIGRLNGV